LAQSIHCYCEGLQRSYTESLSLSVRLYAHNLSRIAIGVRAEVNQLNVHSEKIQVSLTVDKPEACDPHDWQQIIRSLDKSSNSTNSLKDAQAKFTSQQQHKLERLLAHLIQAGHTNRSTDWDTLYPQLQALDLDELTLQGIRAALKVPQSLDQLVKDLDSDLAAVALPKAVSIALLDRQVNPPEDHALSALFQVVEPPASKD
jgi:hypothetical protein